MFGKGPFFLSFCDFFWITKPRKEETKTAY